MRNKHRKHFTITLLLSLAIHLFALTVLFTLPEPDEQEGYKKVKVKLSTKNKLQDNIKAAEKYAAYNPSAGNLLSPQVVENSSKKMPEISDSNTQILPAIMAVETTEDKGALAPSSTQEKEPKTNTDIHKTEIFSVSENAANDTAIPRISSVPTPNIKNSPTEIDDKDSTIIGNSLDKNASGLASYEQMLSLWLDKFKEYPKNANGSRIEGNGEIFIKIDRKGKILLSNIIKSTGSTVLDAALMKMIADADPVLPVPIDYHTDKKTFSYKIAFEFKGP